jgi:enoyl-CoA hydratase
MTVTYELDADGVAHARMDDGKANVLNDTSCAGLRDAIARAGDDRAGALVIWGREGMFSGGIDLTVIRSDDPEARLASLCGIAHTLLAVWTAPIPTVAAVTGHAIAGGAILAMACDRRIVTSGGAKPPKLGVNETQLGMVFPTWAIAIVAAGIKPEHHTEVMLEGPLLDPAGAARVGLVHEVADDLVEAVARATGALAPLPTKAYAGNKAMLRRAVAAAAAERVAAEMGADFARDA